MLLLAFLTSRGRLTSASDMTSPEAIETPTVRLEGLLAVCQGGHRGACRRRMGLLTVATLGVGSLTSLGIRE